MVSAANRVDRIEMIAVGSAVAAQHDRDGGARLCRSTVR